MTPDNAHIFKNKQSGGEFMLNKTDCPIKKEKNIIKSLVDPGTLTQRFPNILTGGLFMDAAVAWAEDLSAFGVLAIRIDNVARKDETMEKTYAAGLLADVAETVDEVCTEEKGIWGVTDRNLFVCMIPEADTARCREASSRIRERFAGKRKETLTAGIAVYPQIDFEKGRIVENARKAIDHARFFGPGSTAVFDAVTLNISGDNLYQAGDMEGAAEEYRTALKIDPENLNVRNSLGVCYGSMGLSEKALAEFTAAAAINGRDVMAHYNAGLVYLSADDPQKALECFLKAESAGEATFDVLYQIGRMYYSGGTYESALDYLNRAERIDPRSNPLFRWMGKCYEALNKTDQATAAYKTAVKINPYDAESLSALGCLLDLQGENPEISTLFCKHSVEIAPKNGLYRFRLGKLYMKQRRFNDALAELTRARRLGYDASIDIETLKTMMADEGI